MERNSALDCQAWGEAKLAQASNVSFLKPQTLCFLWSLRTGIVPFSLLQTAQRKIREIVQQVKQQAQKYPQGVAPQRSK